MNAVITFHRQRPGAATTAGPAAPQTDVDPERPTAAAAAAPGPGAGGAGAAHQALAMAPVGPPPAGPDGAPMAASSFFDGVALGLAQTLLAAVRGPLTIADEVGTSTPLAAMLRQAGHALTAPQPGAVDLADVALAMDCLYSATDIPATLATQAARLRPGGALLASLPLAGGSRPALDARALQPQQALQRVAEAGLQVLQACLLPDNKGLFVAATRPESDGRIKALGHALNLRMLKVLHPGLMTNNGIELTNLCNLRCKLCPTPTTRAVTGYADDATVLAALTYTAPGTHFSFHRLGEPLMHPKLLDYVRWTRERGVTPLVSTNGLLLTQAILEALIEAGTGNLQITFHTSASVKAYALAARHLLKHPHLQQQIELVGNALSHQTEVPKWLDHHRVTPDERRFIRDVKSHNWAGNVPGTRVNFKDDVVARRQKRCYYINHNVASVRWDGTVVGCCFDSENDNVIGHIQDYPKLAHKPLEYRLCRTCDPNWANGFVD